MLGISQQDAKTVSNIASVITSVASVFSAINAAINVLTFLGVLSSADVVGEIEQAIDQLWQEFQGAVAALDTEDSMKDVQNQVAQSQTELTNLTEFAPTMRPPLASIQPGMSCVLSFSQFLVASLDARSASLLAACLPPRPGVQRKSEWKSSYPGSLALYLFSPTTAGGLVFELSADTASLPRGNRDTVDYTCSRSCPITRTLRAPNCRTWRQH